MEEIKIGDKFYTILEGDYWGYITVTDISDMTVCWKESTLDDKALRHKCWGKPAFIRCFVRSKQYNEDVYRQANELISHLQCRADLAAMYVGERV